MSGGNYNQRRDASWLESYEKVDDRIAKFREDFPGAMGRIETVPLHTEQMCIWEARISVRTYDEAPTGEKFITDFFLIANGHAYDKWGAASQAEKTEKAAIGRALVMAGYAAQAGASREEMELHERREQAQDTRTHRVAAPRGDGNTKQAQDAEPPVAKAAHTPTPWEHIDRQKAGASYCVIIDKAREMVDDGKSLAEIKTYLSGRRKAMTDRQYADAQYRLGEIEYLILDRDNEAAARAELDGDDDRGKVRQAHPAQGDTDDF